MSKDARKGRSYSVWHDHQEQWDADDIDHPRFTCTASSFLAAAERLADEGDNNCPRFIVRDDEAGAYQIVELRRGWSVIHEMRTTIEELCAP